MRRYEHEETYNDDLVECPYCGSTYQPEAEDFSEDPSSEECEECGKTYWLHQQFSVTHVTSPDCELNSIPHDYQPVKLRNGRIHPFCTVCGKCQPHDELPAAG